MCIMGPMDIKEDIYYVMTYSRELTNYCQESVKSIHSAVGDNELVLGCVKAIRHMSVDELHHLNLMPQLMQRLFLL